MLDIHFKNHTFDEIYFNGDLEFVVFMMRGFLKNYEAVSIDNIRKALTYMKKCIDAHVEVVYTYDKSFYDDFFIVMDRIMGKLYFEVNIF